eukprot:514565-Pyramimonas_sp.AAC.1
MSRPEAGLNGGPGILPETSSPLMTLKLKHGNIFTDGGRTTAKMWLSPPCRAHSFLTICKSFTD